MTLQEWVALYEKKTGEKFKQDNKFCLFFSPIKGFCEYGMSGDMVFLNQLCGDAKYWKAKAEEIAKANGIHHLGTWCIRKEIKAYIRLFGYRIAAEENLSDGLKRYHGEDKKTNKPALASPAFIGSNGVQAYFITWTI